MSGLRARLQALFGGLQRWYAGHSPRDQRIILGVLVFAAVCVAYLWAWVPMREYRRNVADEIAEGQEQLARAARVLASAESVRADREELEQKLKQARQRLLPGRGGTLGAAALQERTNSLAAEKGVTVQSAQVMKEEAIDPYRKVAVRLTLSGELKPFAEFVSALEYGQQLAVPIVEINRRGAVPGAKGPRTLSATVEVAGFVLSEEAKTEDGSPPESGEVADAGAAEGSDAAKVPEGAAGTGATGPAAAAVGAAGAPSGPAAATPAPTGAATAPEAAASGPTGAPSGPPAAGPKPTDAPAAPPAAAARPAGAPNGPAHALPPAASGAIPMVPFGMKKAPSVPPGASTSVPRVTPPVGSTLPGRKPTAMGPGPTVPPPRTPPPAAPAEPQGESD